MRKAIPALLLAALAFTGCMTDEPSVDGTTSDGAGTTGTTWDDDGFNWTGLDRSYPYHAMEEFCMDEASCDYWDGQFHEGTVYELDTLVVDAFVLPAPSPSPTGATEAAAMATAGWMRVEEFTADWFTEAWELHTYVVGQDVPPAEAAADPEIIVVTEGFQRSTSIGLNAEQLACSIVGPTGLIIAEDAAPGTLATHVYPVHEHDGMAIYAAECITGGFRCLALNFAGTVLGGNNPLYDLVAHEVGHCLGLSHVGDALDFNSRFVPTLDIMAYADNPSRVSCPSTLNARVMEGIYAELAGQPVPAWMTGDDAEHPEDHRFAMDPWDYQVTECPLPPAGII